ncbi:uncharacterized protein RAG0_02342 [Rhynchosporium agropyri]|uniref:Uncharacterized protein n=1 Tax=Rhynchosporium agropyri TaxID=914238 RepID=A0A1E1K119_9HELO|nr:uncharacterized protein RAG0_02342 [Rhynchosporium agropyri]
MSDPCVVGKNNVLNSSKSDLQGPAKLSPKSSNDMQPLSSHSVIRDDVNSLIEDFKGALPSLLLKEGTQLVGGFKDEERVFKNMCTHIDIADVFTGATDYGKKFMSAEFPARASREALENVREELYDIESEHRAEIIRQINIIQEKQADSKETTRQVTKTLQGLLVERGRCAFLEAEIKQKKMDIYKLTRDYDASVKDLKDTKDELQAQVDANADLKVAQVKVKRGLEERHMMEMLKKKEQEQELLGQIRGLTDLLKSAWSADLVEQLEAAKDDAHNIGQCNKILIEMRNDAEADSGAQITALQEALDLANREVRELKHKAVADD